MLEDDQTLSFLPTVLRADVVSAFEEKSGKQGCQEQDEICMVGLLTGAPPGGV